MQLIGPRLRDLFRPAISLSSAAALLRDAIDRSGLQHVELEGQQQDYRYVILTLCGDFRDWSPHKDDPDFLIDGHGYTRRHFVEPSALLAGIKTYLSALKTWRHD